MKILVLCIDRDNDIGVKAGIKSPVIGRAQNLKAATALALRDPEDSDTNAIFAAISTYDDLVKKDIDAEVATIAGDINVGVKSDHILTEQLDSVIETVKPGRVYLVSDGAEDAQIYPIVSSRIKVNHVKRVFIKQDKSIESTYYMLVKTFQDEKMRKKIFTPIGLILAIAGIGLVAIVALDMFFPDVAYVKFIPGMVFAAAALLLGIYFLNHAYRIGDSIQTSYENLKDAIVTSKVSFFSILIAMIVSMVGLYYAYNIAVDAVIKDRPLIFMESYAIFIILSAWIYVAGHSLDFYIRRGRMERAFAVKTVSILATGFIVYAILSAIRLFVFQIDNPMQQYYVIGIEAGAGLTIGILGGVLHHYSKEQIDREARWRH